MLKDYTQASLTDVDEIVRTIRALRETAKRSNVKTTNTQSLILRAVPGAVLCEVALKLQEAEVR